MKELMIHVERIVRPVRADWSKLKMRRELLAHLQAAFEQERERGADEATAIAAAKRRLGDPAALTRQLQASVSRLERLAVTPFPGSVPLILLCLGVLLPVILAIAPVPGGLTSRHAGSFASVAEVAPRHARAIFVGGIVVMELGLFLWYAFTIGFFPPRRMRWPRVAGAGVAAFVAQLAGISLLTFALTGRAAPGELAQAALGSLLAPAFFASGGIAAVLAMRPLRKWLELDIAD